MPVNEEFEAFKINDDKLVLNQIVNRIIVIKDKTYFVKTIILKGDVKVKTLEQ